MEEDMVADLMEDTEADLEADMGAVLEVDLEVDLEAVQVEVLEVAPEKQELATSILQNKFKSQCHTQYQYQLKRRFQFQ